MQAKRMTEQEQFNDSAQERFLNFLQTESILDLKLEDELW